MLSRSFLSFIGSTIILNIRALALGLLYARRSLPYIMERSGWNQKRIMERYSLSSFLYNNLEPAFQTLKTINAENMDITLMLIDDDTDDIKLFIESAKEVDPAIKCITAT